MLIIQYILVIAGLYLSLYVGYCVFLTIMNFIIKDKVKLEAQAKTKFAVIIPAHNEEIFLPRLLKSLREQRYPEHLFDVVVIADNCTDGTCSVAAATNAIVLERQDKMNIGKGYAIKFAIENIQIDRYGAVFVVDADSVVDRDALLNLDQSIREGNKAIQCFNGVANPDQSWFTRLLDVSRTISNEIFERAKEKLGLSSHLMGNGMCFSADVIGGYGWYAFTVGEDWEYYARLIERGERVSFARNARVYHQESRTLKQATPQRMRWSSGRLAISYQYGIKLFVRGLVEGDLLKMDAVLPLLFPNPSMGVYLSILLILVPLVFAWWSFVFWFATIFVLQLLIFGIGIMYTKNRTRNFLAMFMAPTFLAWKMIIDLFALLGFGRKRWVRTERET